MELKKTSMVARYTAESKYRAMALYSTKITWIISLLNELKIEVERIPMFLSNCTSAAVIAAYIVYHSNTKHFHIYLYFIIDKVTRGEDKLCCQ